MSWRVHIDELTFRLNKVCYAIRLVKPFLSLEVLRMIYFSYVHSIISYGIILLVVKLYIKIKKRIMRVIMGSGSRNSCHELFKKIWKSCFSSISVYFLYYCLLIDWLIENCLDLILMNITLIQDVILAYIYQQQI